MSYRRLMVHRCTIRRRTGSAKDEYNNPIASPWGDSSTGVPCRLVPKGGTESEVPGETVIENFALHFLPSADLLETDRIKMTNPVFATELDVELVKPVYTRNGREHHKEVDVRRVKS